ncbi:MAG: hypothetical protein ACFB01_00095 [Cohaesibacteraceae bacterium]
MTVNSVTQSTMNIERMLSIRAEIDNLGRQLGTGLREDNYADLGPQRTTSLAIRADRTTIAGYQAAIQSASVSVNIMNETVERLDDLLEDVKGDAIPNTFVVENGNQTTAQIAAEHRLQEMVTLLNTDIDGKYLFSGLSSDVEPVVSAEALMMGSGGRAGFEQVLAERNLADLGGTLADPTLDGRLDLATVGAIASITEAGNDVFGFQLDTAAGASSTSANITETGPAGASNSLSFEVTGTVDLGETLRFTLAMPDGSSRDIVLEAADAREEGDLSFVVDADPLVTAANITAALTDVIDDVARRDLIAASAHQAGHDFFDNVPPLRVTPDPVAGIAGATALAGDPANTIIWYQGEDGPVDARDTRLTRVDENVRVAHGARANESAFATALRETAVFAAMDYDVSDDSAADRYTELANRTRAGLDDPSGQNLPRSVSVELGTAFTMMEATSARHRSTDAIYANLLNDVEGVTEEEVAAKLLDLQTRLQATYSLTATLSELTLVNFLR